MASKAMKTERAEVANTVEIVGGDLRINAKGKFLPTVKVALDHVLGAEADPEIERKLWRAWAFGRRGSLYCSHGVAEPGVRFYNPRFGNRKRPS